jgi:hypothetical protein
MTEGAAQPFRRKGASLCAIPYMGEEYSIPPYGGMKIENARTPSGRDIPCGQKRKEQEILQPA